MQRCLLKTIGLAVFCAVLSAACISAPPPKPSSAEKARAENLSAAALAGRFEKNITYKTDPMVDRYLNDLSKKLTQGSQDLRLSGDRVVAIEDNGLWRCYSLPGRKIYLSVGLLKQLHFDNEIAAAIALEFGNILQSHVLNHAKSQNQDQGVELDLMGPNGIFNLSEDELKASIKSAMEILYRSGFDMRGMLEIWNIYLSNPERSPFSQTELGELSDFTRTAISRYPPLGNPIVGSDQFASIHKRILQL